MQMLNACTYACSRKTVVQKLHPHSILLLLLLLLYARVDQINCVMCPARRARILNTIAHTHAHAQPHANFHSHCVPPPQCLLRIPLHGTSASRGELFGTHDSHDRRRLPTPAPMRSQTFALSENFGVQDTQWQT